MMLSAQPAAKNGFPAELEDREWLAARYRSLGDETIASELRVSLKAIRRARERLGIDGPVDAARSPAPPASANGAGVAQANGASRSGTNGASAVNGVNAARVNGAAAPGTNGSSVVGGFVSDEELSRRIGRVKKGLADTCARLVTAINELEWVREQVAPPEQAAPPERTPSRPHA
jgi:hypothetical protein